MEDSNIRQAGQLQVPPLPQPDLGGQEGLSSQPRALHTGGDETAGINEFLGGQRPGCVGARLEGFWKWEGAPSLALFCLLLFRPFWAYLQFPSSCYPLGPSAWDILCLTWGQLTLITLGTLPGATFLTPDSHIFKV